jgi:class 3 adenylate cyclase
MSAEIKKEIQLEIAHVLFVDVVGYSKLSINDQHAAVEELNRIVRASEQFQRAEAASRLLKIPTGDGMALVFYASPEAPAQCAVEISRAVKEHPRLHLRMGIHSGPVSGVVDVTGRANLTGAGINMAKRVMDCGDAGHILATGRYLARSCSPEHLRLSGGTRKALIVVTIIEIRPLETAGKYTRVYLGSFVVAAKMES